MPEVVNQQAYLVTVYLLLNNPVFQCQSVHPRKLHIVRHQTAPAAMAAGNGRAVRADRRPGEGSATRMSVGVHRGPVPGRMVSRRAQNASTSWIWRGEAFGLVALKRISAYVTAETTMRSPRSTACSVRFSTAAGCSRIMNEQMLVSSIRFLHGSKRPSSLTTSSRSAIKSGSGPVQLRERAPGRRRTGRRNDCPLPGRSQPRWRRQNRVPGRRMARLLPF